MTKNKNNNNNREIKCKNDTSNDLLKFEVNYILRELSTTALMIPDEKKGYKKMTNYLQHGYWFKLITKSAKNGIEL